jgi:DNA-binding response OmpR family regulator
MDKKCRILLVDDEQDFADSMGFWLRARGYSVLVSYDCENALKTIREDAPDLVFLDVVMPGINGLAMLKKIREFNETIPIIMMSSFIKESRNEDESNFYNVSGIFNKGHNLSKALILIKAALDKKK